VPTFWVVEKGKPAGPFSLEELKSRAIKSETFVKSDTMDDYKEAHEIFSVTSDEWPEKYSEDTLSIQEITQ
jgi:hypothetical protein